MSQEQTNSGDQQTSDRSVTGAAGDLLPAQQPRVSAATGKSPPPPTELGWPILRRLNWLPIAVACAVVTVAALPHLPPGICFADVGDLQLASATLGIMHSPGYAGYVTLGYLATRLTDIDPAYAVSLTCLASGIVALALCILIQVRLGVSPWIASAITLTLTDHKRIWTNLVAPEVYMPSLMFVAAAALGLIEYARSRSRKHLFIAAAMFGVALANRPTVVWMLPFFLAAWWVAGRRRHRSWRRSVNTALCAALFAALPGLYSLVFTWVRDTPQTTYNYVGEKNADLGILPYASEGWNAKAERVYWHVTAREFERNMDYTWRSVCSRLRWLYYEFFLYRIVEVLGVPLIIGPATFFIVAPLPVLGGMMVYLRSRVGFWLLAGLAVGNVVFICTYRIHGPAADLLALLFSGAVLAGVMVSPLFPVGGGRFRQAVAVGLFALVCALTVIHGPRRGARTSADATSFVAELDMQSLPRDAAIYSPWGQSTVLWYAKYILSKREDIDIINSVPRRWRAKIEALPDRPVFAVRDIYEPGELVLTRYRNIWRVERFWTGFQPVKNRSNTAESAQD